MTNNSHQQRRPNILLITTDQQRFDHIGLKGLKGVDTPNLDRLGREGVHFDRAYTCSPLCTPARLSLLTGQYPSVHGGYSIGVTVDPFPNRTIPSILRDAGYATALFGKAHFVCRQDEKKLFAGCDDPSPDYFRTHTGPYVGFDHALTSTGHTTNQVPDMHYRVFLEEHGLDYGAYFPDVNGRHDHGAAGAWNIPPEYHDTAWVSGNVIDWIRGFKQASNQYYDGFQRPDGKPWFAWASFQDPHEPFVCPQPWYSRIRDDEIELYEGYREGEFGDKPIFYHQAYGAGFQNLGQSRDHPEERQPGSWSEFQDGKGIPSAFRRGDLEGKEKKALKATLGMVSYIDDRVGAIIDALHETGQADNTLVIFTTDHGEIHGHHGLWHKGLFPYDDCHRVPFLAWGPELVEQIGTTDALANIMDIPKTILSHAGTWPQQGIQGEDLSPILKGETERVQDEVIVELHATPHVYQQTMVTDRYKLVVYRDFEDGELYDMHKDPDQYTNLWNSPDHQELKTNLLQQFVQANMRKDGYGHTRKAFA